MAWALQFDGVDDYLNTNLYSLNTSGDFSIEFESTYTANTIIILGRSDATNRFIAWRAGGAIRLRTSAASFDFNLGLVDSTVYKIKIVVVSGSVDIFVDDILTASGSISGLIEYNSIGAWGNTTYRFLGQVRYITVTDNVTSSNSVDWDATASNHTTGQPVLTDTIGGNDATGVNFPTDGSAWIDLGGGVIADLFAVSKKPTASITASATIPAITAEIAVTSKRPLVSIVGSVTLPNPISDISVLSKKPVASISASASIPNPTADIQVTAKKPTVEIFASVIDTGVDADISVIAKKPTVAISSSVTLPNPSSDINVTAKKPVVLISATVSGLIILPPDDAKLTYELGSNYLEYEPGSNKLAL